MPGPQRCRGALGLLVKGSQRRAGFGRRWSWNPTRRCCRPEWGLPATVRRRRRRLRRRSRRPPASLPAPVSRGLRPRSARSPTGRRACRRCPCQAARLSGRCRRVRRGRRPPRAAVMQGRRRESGRGPGPRSFGCPIGPLPPRSRCPQWHWRSRQPVAPSFRCRSCSRSRPG